MTIKEFTQDKIHDNPYQKRPVPPASVKELGENIKQYGLQNKPKARPHPSKAGHVQLLEGHRRTVAWFTWAFPGQPIPLDVQEGIDDRRMFELNVIENMHREPPTSIQVAIQIKAYMDEFHVSQSEAGKLFNLNTQGAVSNKLGMLKLPKDVQDLVNAGSLAERDARKMIPLMKFLPGKVSSVALSAVKKENVSDEIEEGIWRLVRGSAQSMYRADWPLTWPAQPIKVEKPNNKMGEPAELPACEGCEFLYECNDQTFCLRPGCFKLKAKLHAKAEAERAAKRLGIPLLGPGENATLLFSGEWLDHQRRERLKKAIAAKLPELRLKPLGEMDDDYDLKQMLGSCYVHLFATNVSAVNAWLNNGAKSEKKAAPKKETAEQKATRLEYTEATKVARRAERSNFLRSKQDVLWLIENTAGLIAQEMKIAGGILPLAEEDICRRSHDVSHSMWPEFGEIENHLRKGDEFTARKHIALCVLGATILGYSKPAEAYAFKDALKDIERVAEKVFVVDLPPAWNKPPIHETEFNCWKCGTFAGNTKITKRDLADGWVQKVESKKVVSVTCPTCSPSTNGKSKPAPVKKSKPKGKKK